MHFDWDSALALQGDSGPYILYAYARITGIRERAEEAGVKLPDPSVEQLDSLGFDSDAAYFLAEQIDEFGKALRACAADHEPAVLANYTLELAKRVAKAYLDLKVVGEPQEVASSRLALFVKAQTVLGHCISLLGMSALQRM